MAEHDVLTDAEARYLEEIRDDCEACLGPGTELREIRRETTDEGVRLAVRYRLGESDRESSATGETMLAAHRTLRARILFDRIRFGYSDLVETR